MLQRGCLRYQWPRLSICTRAGSFCLGNILLFDGKVTVSVEQHVTYGLCGDPSSRLWDQRFTSQRLVQQRSWAKFAPVLKLSRIAGGADRTAARPRHLERVEISPDLLLIYQAENEVLPAEWHVCSLAFNGPMNRVKYQHGPSALAKTSRELHVTGSSSFLTEASELTGLCTCNVRRYPDWRNAYDTGDDMVTWPSKHLNGTLINQHAKNILKGY